MRPSLNAIVLAAAVTVLASACVTTTTQSTKPVALPRTNAAVTEASMLAQNHASLSGQAKLDNAREIERLLGGLDNATLTTQSALLVEGDPLYNFAGRELLRRGLDLPRPFDRDGNWRFDAGNRPAADRDGYRPPVKLAVLLPLSGGMAVAASPVRDGFLAGYYGEHRQRPEIEFFDTTGTATGTIAAYQKAVAAGADYVLGPLGRDEVSALFKQPQLSVPVLALNRGTVSPPAGNASFALAPEDDGIAAAEYLLSRKARKVLVLTGSDDNMRRSATAFSEQLTSRGGRVVESISITDKPTDALAAIQAAMQKEGSVDAVFLALRGGQARALAAPLAAAGLNTKTRVATSQLLSGTGKAEEDKLLDGIAFPTEAWGVQGVSGLPAASNTAKSLPTARGPAAKLFAFGYDAWQLTAYLERLAKNANGHIDGATGKLRVDGFGNILRTPAWSTFSNGQIIAISQSGG